MKDKTKVSIEYLGAWSARDSKEYRITKIIGAPVIEVKVDQQYRLARVGDIITETQAIELSSRNEVVTTQWSRNEK